MPDTGAEVRADGATGFQALAKESTTAGSQLFQLNIKIVIGRLMNKNKNPVAENTIQEIHEEILKLKGRQGSISPTELAIILRNINNRVRYNNLTPKEIMFRRDALSHNPVDIEDQVIMNQQSSQKSKAAISSKNIQPNLKSRCQNRHFM